MAVHTHYVDPHTPVLRQVQKSVRVSVVPSSASRLADVSTVPPEDPTSHESEMEQLRREQREIEAQLRTLEEQEARFHEAEQQRQQQQQQQQQQQRSVPRAVREMEEQHAAAMTEYDSFIREHSRDQASTEDEPPESLLQLHQRRREANLVVQPFSFEARERVRQAVPTARAERKKRDERLRVEKELQEVVQPAGARDTFRANPVPPSTFINKLELMQIEAEERHLQNKEKARERAKRSCTPRATPTGYISDPLRCTKRRSTSYVPVEQRMAAHPAFKARPVPRAVLEPKWDKIAESEVIRKMDIKEAARYKLARYEQTLPRACSVPRNRSASQPALPEECRFRPKINASVPDFLKLREKEALETLCRKEKKRLTKPQAFSLSGSNGLTVEGVQHDMARDEMMLPEDRWPYVSSRLPPKRASPRRTSAPPTRYTRAANMALLDRSVKLLQQEEQRKAKEKEEAHRQERQKQVAATLRRFKTSDKQGSEPSGVPKWKEETRNWKTKREEILRSVHQEKPIWLRAPENQAADAAGRAHADDVAQRPVDDASEPSEAAPSPVASPRSETSNEEKSSAASSDYED